MFSKDTIHARLGHAQYPIRELFPVAEKLEKAGAKIAKVNIGDPVPYFGTPEYIREAFCRVVREGKTSYGRSPGENPFLEAIARRYRRKFGVDFPPERIFITQGVSEAIQFLNMCLAGKGRGAILFSPFYPTYVPKLKIYDGTPYLSPCIEEKGWAPDMEGLGRLISKAKADGTDLKYLLIINPCNPTGALWERGQLEEVAAIAREHDLLLVSDEIYDEIVFDGENYASVANVAKGQPHVILNGLSKGWCATGLRTGWMVIEGGGRACDELRDAVIRLGTLRLCPNIPAQYAGVEALDNTKAHSEFLYQFVPEIRRRSDYCWKRLNEIPGVSCQRAKGAFYLLPKLDLARSGCKTDSEFVRKLLEEQKVWAVQGSGFGAEGHLRIVTLPPTETLEAACAGIEKLMKQSGTSTSSRNDRKAF